MYGLVTNSQSSRTDTQGPVRRRAKKDRPACAAGSPKAQELEAPSTLEGGSAAGAENG